MALHCPECGFVNADGANYCQKCGSFLGNREERSGGEPSTATYRIDETGELVPVDVEQVVAHEGAALVIRAGGGRVGESFALDHERMTIGRRPDSDVFLDDITVSRDHALLVICGVVVCWYHELLPPWALAVLIGRELFMLLAGQYVLKQGRELKINMVGRWAVWPVMSAIFLALCGVDTVAEVLLYVGLVLTLWATALYVRDARPSTSA